MPDRITEVPLGTQSLDRFAEVLPPELWHEVASAVERGRELFADRRLVNVNSTARGAFNLGYSPSVVAAATATRALPGTDGTPVPAAALHVASLAAIADLFAVVVAAPGDVP